MSCHDSIEASSAVGKTEQLHSSGPALWCTVLTLLLLASCNQTEVPQTDFDKLLLEGSSQYAQFKEEPILRHYFRDRRDGFYVDIGCFDPKKLSPTYYLEANLGVSGIGVDALEEYAPLWKEQRPASKFFSYVVTDKSGETVVFYEHGGISSTEIRNIEDWEKRAKTDLHEKPVEHPTITMNDLLDREGVQAIDFLSIDVNGTEPTVMRGFDIQRFRPEPVLIEVHKRNRVALMEYFTKNGYRRIEEYMKYDVANWYFTPADG